MPTLNDLVRADGVKLKRIGSNRHIGLCPFHSEKTASFHVYSAKRQERYHCFGCGADGDAIQWLRDFRHMAYREAASFLGAEMSERKTRKQLQEQDRAENARIHAAYVRRLWLRRMDKHYGFDSAELAVNAGVDFAECLSWLSHWRIWLTEKSALELGALL